MAEPDPGLVTAADMEEHVNDWDEEEGEALEDMEEDTAGQQQTGSKNRKRPLHPRSQENLEPKACTHIKPDGTRCQGSVPSRWVCSQDLALWTLPLWPCFT